VRFFRKKPTFAAKFFIVFTPLIRFTLLILCTIVGIISALSGWNYLIIIAALLSVSLLWGYYNVGTVYLAPHKLRKGKYTLRMGPLCPKIFRKTKNKQKKK